MTAAAVYASPVADITFTTTAPAIAAPVANAAMPLLFHCFLPLACLKAAFTSQSCLHWIQEPMMESLLLLLLLPGSAAVAEIAAQVAPAADPFAAA